MRFFVLMLSTTVLLSAGCSAIGQAADLAGSEWRPTRLGAETVADDVQVFVQFGGEGRITGNGGCNRFSGTYRTDDDGIDIGPLATTRKACPPPVMAIEHAVLTALESATTYHRNRVVLTLFDENGEEIARFAQTDWD